MDLGTALLSPATTIPPLITPAIQTSPPSGPCAGTVRHHPALIPPDIHLDPRQPMERLCDDILQLIFYELPDPGPFTQVSRRIYRFSQDPYVRARYFLIHYGPTEAIYYALGRGKVLTERALDILLTSGAHLSRYLIQTAMHHYFHAQSHFIKTAWVRNVPLKVFLHFLHRAEEAYGEIPRGKGEDDGSIFTTFLKESKWPAQMKTLTWETVKVLMETYRFIPFCARDPIMAQFLLALAVEPRLLPYAAANGFRMDYKYRDFVFRKMFERPSVTSDTSAEDIANTVRELLRLDATMFVTRTVAAEVCMEPRVNDTGYLALKLLDKSGHLRFELRELVEDLTKTFVDTRSIVSQTTGETLLHLYLDFPSQDVCVRLVILIIVFMAAESAELTADGVKSKLELLGIGPLTRQDVLNILVNPFTERFKTLIAFARLEVASEGTGMKGLNEQEIHDLVCEVAIRCLEIGCKGKLLKRLCEEFKFLDKAIEKAVLDNYRVCIEDLPSWEDEPDCVFQTSLCRDFVLFGLMPVHTLDNLRPKSAKMECDEGGGVSEQVENSESTKAYLLGEISQETLTTMIRHDETTPVRSRRRHVFPYGTIDAIGKLRYPHDSLQVGRWVRSHFGTQSPVTAVFMTHAVVNHNSGILHHYLTHPELPVNITTQVPVTLRHFQVLARLGRAPTHHLYHNIEFGAEFFFDENDYICRADSQSAKDENTTTASDSMSRKRPRRSAAATVSSYAVPDSDDEVIQSDDDPMEGVKSKEKRSKSEGSLKLWIKHLAELLRIENRKYTERRKQLEKMCPPGEKIRQSKNEFVKSLTSQLRKLRKVQAEKATQEQAFTDMMDDDSDEDDEDEYVARTAKRRKGLSTPH